MTPLYPHVAVGVDQSEASDAALRKAARLAAGGGRLTIIHVVAPVPVYHTITGKEIPISPGAHAAAEAWLASVAASVPGAEPVLIDSGHAGDAIVTWCRDNDPDLLVIAPHQRLLSRAFIGSVANFVLRNAAAPVFVVRTGLPDARDPA